MGKAARLARAVGRELAACDDLPAALRMVKSEAGIARLRAAGRVTHVAGEAARQALDRRAVLH